MDAISYRKTLTCAPSAAQTRGGATRWNMDDRYKANKGTTEKANRGRREMVGSHVRRVCAWTREAPTESGESASLATGWQDRSRCCTPPTPIDTPTLGRGGPPRKNPSDAPFIAALARHHPHSCSTATGHAKKMAQVQASPWYHIYLWRNAGSPVGTQSPTPRRGPWIPTRGSSGSHTTEGTRSTQRQRGIEMTHARGERGTWKAGRGGETMGSTKSEFRTFNFGVIKLRAQLMFRCYGF